MTNYKVSHYLIEPAKKIEIFLINSRDKAIRSIVKSVINARELELVKRELAINFTLALIKKMRLRIKLDALKINPLRKLSEILRDNYYKLIHLNFHDKSLIESNPLELLSPVKLVTIIFFRKIKRIFTRKTIEFLELILRESESKSHVIIGLLIALYFDYLSRRDRDRVEKYFLVSKDFMRTLILAALLYLLRETSVRILVLTKKTYFKNKYLAGYSLSELPLGTKLVVIDKSSSYYRARKLDSELSKTYILHIDEVEIIEKKARMNVEIQEKIKKIIKEITRS